jgi:hypothetical protein
MRRLLKYAIVLALAVAIGAYIVLGPLSLDDFFPSHPEREALADLEPPPASSASIDEELDYMVAKRLGSLEGWRAFLAAHANGAYAHSAQAEVRKRLGVNDASAEAPVAAPASASVDNQRGYGVVERLGSLASYAQSATAKVEQLLLAEKAPAKATVAPTASASIDEVLDHEVAQRLGSLEGWRAFLAAHGSGVYAQSARAEFLRLLLAENAAAPASAENSKVASPDAKAASKGALPTSPLEGTEVAALTPDEMCKRDGDRLARLRGHPSREEAQRLASELGCEKLRPQVLDLMESLRDPVPAPAAAPAELSNGASTDAKMVSDAPRPVLPLAGTEVAAVTPNEICARDADRLARLRDNPSGEEAQRFASDLGCEKLRPQLLRLTESFGDVVRAPAVAAVPRGASADSKAVNETSRPARPLAGTKVAALTADEICKRDGDRLARLRGSPSDEEAQRFANELDCEKLRPQLLRLMESLGVAPPAPTPNGTDPGACRRETAELNRIRAAPELSNAKRFASVVTCDALKPQAARLLESLSE